MKEKPMAFYELKDALARGDCPLCFLAERSVTRYIDSLFHENVNDVGIAAEIKRSGGFCEKHSDEILKTHESLGIAIIYQRLVNVFINLLQRTKTIKKLAPCPLCQVYLETEQRYTDILVNNWNELKETFAASSILCVDHTEKALNAASKQNKIRKEILEIQIKKLSNLSAELEEYCRKYDYRFKDEEWGKEKDVWQRAVKLMAHIPKKWRK